MSTGLTIVLYTFPLIWIGILASHNTPVSSLHFCHAILILYLTSCSQPPCAFITDPRYLNVTVCFSATPAASLMIINPGVFEQTMVSVLLMLTLRPLLSSALCHDVKRVCNF